jgi:hypothetical protein
MWMINRGPYRSNGKVSAVVLDLTPCTIRNMIKVVFAIRLIEAKRS